MSQSAVTAPSDSNKLPNSKDIYSASSVSSRLRSNRHSQDSEKTFAKDTASSNPDPQNPNSPADESQVVDRTSACMTRQRTAIVVPLNKPSLQKDDESPLQSAISEAVSQICLCQPDPKIPRPRNAFILYRQHHQQNIVSQNRGLSNPEISKIAGQLWQNEPEKSKNEWKALAEEEKARHAQQYPDYRFQPRHKNKTTPISPPGEKDRCQKCGGQSIAANSSPFLTPLPTGNPKLKFAGAPSLPTPPNTSREGDPRRMLGSAGQTYHSDPCYIKVGSSMTRKFPDTPAELSDPKRRKYDSYGANAPSTRPEFVRTIVTNGQAPASAHPPYPSPRTVDPRRGSLTGPPEGSYYIQQGPVSHITDSPPPVTPHSAAPTMGPPPTRVASISGRSGLHVYPATPTSIQYHGLPYPSESRARTDSESNRLAPLLSPGAGDHCRSIGAMIMTIPVVGKLGTLRRIAPPIREHSPDSPPYRVRGSIIAIEGDDRCAAEGMLGQLETFLRRNDEFDVRVLSGPRNPRKPCELKDFIEMVAEWHDETKKMINFVTGVEYQRNQEHKASEATMQQTGLKKPIASGGDDGMDTDTEEGELLDGARKDSHDARCESRARDLERKRAEAEEAAERISERQSPAQEQTSKIPLLLVKNYILYGSNAWSSALPINDIYSPADHWTWTATLWRGIIGADQTVYVRNMEKEREELVSAGGATPSQSDKKVQMKDDVGAILVKRENGKVEDGAVRRVAFEIGEFVRMKAGKHT